MGREIAGEYDVVVVGGGVQGACLFDRLADGGRRVLLVDRGDFGGGTSQASAMLVWGGLLYLKNGDVREVARLSAARDRWLARSADVAEPHWMSYVYGPRPHRGAAFMRASLWAYWILSGGRRRTPRTDRAFAEQQFLSPAVAAGRHRFEEGRLRVSDSQLVHRWLRLSETARAVNYCGWVGGHFDRQRRLWQLDLDDADAGPVRVTAKWVVNAAGVWADEVNAAAGIGSPWRHRLVKGVSLCVRRPAGHRDTVVFDAADADEGYSLVPWGSVSLWGSTERPVGSPAEGRRVETAEVDGLLDKLNRWTTLDASRADVVSLRCGVRALAVRREAADGDPIRLSRQWRAHVDADRPWVTLYGGKITSSPATARFVATVLDRRLGRRAAVAERAEVPAAEMVDFPGMPAGVPTATWCRRWQACRTLADYLRRRTNLAQWVPRGGLGRHGEHRGRLMNVASELGDDPVAAVKAYGRTIERDHDAVLGTGPSAAPVFR